MHNILVTLVPLNDCPCIAVTNLELVGFDAQSDAGDPASFDAKQNAKQASYVERKSANLL